MNKLSIYRVFEKIGSLLGGKTQSAAQCCCNYADNYYGDRLCTPTELNKSVHPTKTQSEGTKI